MGRGLDAKRLARQIRAIDRLNERLDGIVILKGIEVDILEDGSLDLPDAILKSSLCGSARSTTSSTCPQTGRRSALSGPWTTDRVGEHHDLSEGGRLEGAPRNHRRAESRAHGSGSPLEP